jgi:hypothetical protein
VDKPACVPAKDAWQTVGKRERRKINTFRARLPFSPSPERHNYAAVFCRGSHIGLPLRRTRDVMTHCT